MGEALFVIYALGACLGALAVVLSQNVVRMAFWLVISLGSTAGLFFLLGADFVGATQLLIYVGGTVVLLIFGVMLTASAPFLAIRQTPGEVLQGAVVGLAFLAIVFATVLSVDWEQTQAALVSVDDHGHGHGHALGPAGTGFNPSQEGNTSRSIGTALLGIRFDQDLGDGGHVHQAGGDGHGHSHGEAELSAGYLLPFEIVSVHLLVVLIGAAYLARAKRRNPQVTS